MVSTTPSSNSSQVAYLHINATKPANIAEINIGICTSSLAICTDKKVLQPKYYWK